MSAEKRLVLHLRDGGLEVGNLPYVGVMEPEGSGEWSLVQRQIGKSRYWGVLAAMYPLAWHCCCNGTLQKRPNRPKGGMELQPID